MSLITIDPFSFIAAIRRDTKLFEWVRFVFSISFSCGMSFLFVCGSALSGHRPAAEAIGAGMVAAATFGTVVYRNSALAKGTTVALPEKEAEVELGTDKQIINRP